MSTIVFVEMPAFGHVNPSLPLARELVRRGERVVYYNDAEFQGVVESTGAIFRPYPPGIVTSESIARATQTGDLLRVPRVILRATDTLVAFLLDRFSSERPDAIVLDSNALWGHIAARTVRLPTVSLLTTILLGAAQYRQLGWREWLHALRPMLPSVVPIAQARSRLLRRFDKAVIPQPAFPALGRLNLALFPPAFQPANSRVDATFRFVGQMIDPRTRMDRQYMRPPDPSRSCTCPWAPCIGRRPSSSASALRPSPTCRPDSSWPLAASSTFSRWAASRTTARCAPLSPSSRSSSMPPSSSRTAA